MSQNRRTIGSHSPLEPTQVENGPEALSSERSRQIYRLMVRARVLEERMIQMSKSGSSYFWIGGPGEEAFNVCLGLQVKKGQGPAYDYLHLHYRASATLLAMGMPMVEAIRQAAMTATDPFSMGRNFVGHFAKREWNVVPVSSVVEIQYAMAAGTALMQKRCEDNGVTIVTGGDAGSAEGDFASCLVWSSRPGNEVPVLLVVTNNRWGISTAAETQHGERHIADRGKAFRVPSAVVDGNDPIASWHAIARALNYCRGRRRPYLLEAMVSRLYGHSSASGAERVAGEPDCIALFGQKLLEAEILDDSLIERFQADANAEADAALRQALQEPPPRAVDIQKHTYAPSPVDAVYPVDYTGLPA